MSSVVLLRNSGYSQRVSRRGSRGTTDRSGGIDVRRIFKALIAVLAVILALELVFHFYIARRLIISNVTIRAEENFPYSNDEIIELSGIERGNYFFDVDTARIALKLEQLPVVKNAVVTKTFPSSLSITLEERKPLSALMVMNEEGMVPVYVDEEGVIFRLDGRTGAAAVGGEGTGTIFQSYHDLPILSGVDVPAYQDGLSLPPVLTSFLADLDRLRRENSALYRLISEVKFVKKGESRYEVILYPSQYPVRVRIGSSLSSELMKYIVLVLDVMAREGMLMEIDELDFRTEEVVYRLGRE